MADGVFLGNCPRGFGHIVVRISPGQSPRVSRRTGGVAIAARTRAIAAPTGDRGQRG